MKNFDLNGQVTKKAFQVTKKAFHATKKAFQATKEGWVQMELNAMDSAQNRNLHFPKIHAS
jgi:hypothetical protein